MSDLAVAGRNALANGGQELGRDIAPFRAGQGLDSWSAESFTVPVGREPSGGLIDHRQRRPVAILRGRAPGEEAVTAEHHALDVRIRLGHGAEFQAEVEPWPLPRQKAELATKNLAG